jgi:TonB-linked SusC/RagA family outer membrane protein
MGNYAKSCLLLKPKEFFFSLEKNAKTYLIILMCLFGSSMFSQSIKVTGTVIDQEEGGVLPGVSIIIKGTSKGTQTDFDGNFTISIGGPEDVLVFSYLGYKVKEVKVNGNKTLNVSLAPDSEQLDEIVVIGYGTSKKSDLTGSVVAIGGDAIKEQPIANVAEALTGRLAGVQVNSVEGSPDAEVNIRIRGGGSLSQDSSPLIIVDGFPVDGMSDISPSNIENITVLKDASSTAIYGSRGAYGVIIITTKGARSGKITANFNMFYGVKKIANTIDVLDPQDFVKWQYEHALLRDNENLDSYEQYFGQWQDYDQYKGMKGNNWQKQIYGLMGEVQSRDLSVRGGTDILNFNFNYAHYDVGAIMLGSDFKRDNLSLALKSKVNDKINLSFTVRYSDTEVNGGGANEQNEVSTRDSRLKHSVGYSPIPLSGLTSTDTDETLSSYLINPFVAVNDNQRKKLRKKLTLLGSFSWKVIENLKYESTFGIDNYDYLDYRFFGRSTYYSSNRPLIENQGKPSLEYSDDKRQRFRNTNTLNYDFKKYLGEDHSLKLLLGEEMIVYRANKESTVIQGYPDLFDFDTARKLTSQGVPQSVNNFYSPDDKMLSFFGRVNYSYLDKYLFTATYRADGSSKFSEDNRWGYFPSAAIAWKLNKEKFLNDVSWIDALKVRFSYGQAGNNNIPTGQTALSFQSSNTTYINDVTNYWAPSNILPNPALKWETTTTQNLGLDFTLLDHKLSGSLEVYKNLVTDLLINFPVDGTGYATQYRNMGENQNTGIEASLSYYAIEEKDYGLNFSFNIGANKNKINSLGVMNDFGSSTGWASSDIGNDYLVQVGSPLGIMYGYQSDGRYEVSDFDYDATTGDYTLKNNVVDSEAATGSKSLPGTMKLKDIDGDNLVTTDDNTIIGDANPDFTGGFTINANAYGFDFSAAFNFSVGNDVYNADKVEFSTARSTQQYRNLSSIMADGNRWTNLDPASGQLVTDPTQLAALNANTTMWSPYMSRYIFSDWAVEDGSFLRLNNITIGYTLPEIIISKLGVSKLRFYATANNVFTITNYSGSDPEVSTRRKSPFTPAVDSSPYPRSRQIVFGVNLNF